MAWSERVGGETAIGVEKKKTLNTNLFTTVMFEA